MKESALFGEMVDFRGRQKRKKKKTEEKNVSRSIFVPESKRKKVSKYHRDVQVDTTETGRGSWNPN